ncbi:addiction module toxin, HicA family [Clostridium chromiireducens]|uniref:Addiction module toxin, HicA family n=1 Tax=Clostridium chromiireducens TaxID=225345 RepID=A0A964RSM5_9CLOT|nr:type II toxin-antitoxin system HicA family toxin [Clostridium chromiireducens]MVX66948.1 addiction module toxin, HicA family [Clostridium chromiireducens]
MRYREVVKILRKNGYVLVRTAGSHCQYSKVGSPPITVPNHPGDIKIGILKSIERATGLLL